jgi:lipid-A-disaccharide synthase
VIYKMGFLSWMILKHIVSIDFISMANIVAQEKVFPELIQYQATPSQIASYCRKFIDDKSLYAATKERLKKVRKNLGDAPASLNAAREILED